MGDRVLTVLAVAVLLLAGVAFVAMGVARG